MANKLKVFKIEDSQTGKVYDIEGPEDATDEELSSFLESSLGSEATVSPTQDQSPVTSPEVAGPSGVQTPERQQIETIGVNASAPNEDPRFLNPDQESQLISAWGDPNVTDEQYAAMARDFSEQHGRSYTGPTSFGEDRKGYQKYLANGGEPLGVQYNDWKPTDVLGDYTQQHDPDVGGWGAALEEGMAYNPMGIVTRAIADWTDEEIQGGVTKDTLRQRYPDLNEDQIEEMHDGLIGEMRRRELANAGSQVEERGVSMPTRVVGNIIGGSSPADIVPFGRGASFPARLAEGAIANALPDVAMQAQDISYGAQDEYNPGQTFQAAAEGAALQGVIEGGARALSSTVDRIRSRNSSSAEAREAPAPISVPPTDKRTKAYRTGITQTANEIADHINHLTEGWTNPPEFEVHENFKKVEGVDDDAVAVTLGNGKVLINAENVLAEARARKTTPEVIVAEATYHEALGHHGLSQKFGDELDAVLGDIYENGASTFRKQVDDWMADNPEGYINSANRTARATEEVLAEWSEAGHVPVTIVNKLVNLIKKYARQMGISMKFSERELRGIMSEMVHQNVIGGRKAAATGGTRYSMPGEYVPRRKVDSRMRTEDQKLRRKTDRENIRQQIEDAKARGIDPAELGLPSDPENRYMKAYHGSPHDFDEFDHSNMGRGEGAQAYGWGSYLTDSEAIARGYRDRLSGRGSLEFTHPDSGKRTSLQGFPSPHSIIDALSLPEGDAARSYPVMYAVDELSRGYTLDEAIANAYRDYSHYADQEGVKEGLEKLRKTDAKYKTSGKVYEAEIPDDSKWLEWDKPVSEQPHIVNALEEAGFDVVSSDDYGYQEHRVVSAFDRHERAKYAYDMSDVKNAPLRDRKKFREAAERAKSELLQEERTLEMMIRDSWDGKTVYKWVGNNLRDTHLEGKSWGEDVDGQMLASKAFNEMGITGTKYLDGFSRDRGKGTFNYVIYNDKTPKIVNKYMKRRTEPSDEDRIAGAREILSGALDNYEPTYRSWAEAKRGARDRGLTAKQVRSAKGVGDLDRRLHQYDAVAEVTDNRLAALHEKMNDGTFTMRDKAKYLETIFSYNELLGRIFDDQGEIGRALNAMKALTFTKRKLTDLNKILEEFEGNNVSAFADDGVFNEFTDRVRYLMSTQNTVGAHNMLKTVMKPYWWQYILSFRHAAMLSGLGTHAKNAADNALMVAREFEEAVIALPGGVVRSGLKGAGVKVEDGVSPQEVAARIYGLIRAAFDSGTYINTYDAFKKGHGNTPYSSKIEMQDARIPVVSKVQDALHASDTFFRAFHNNTNLYALGVREARSQGFKGLAAFEEGSNLASQPTQGMIDEARANTNMSLLVDKPSYIASKLEAAKAIRPGMKGGEQAGAFFANFVFPFFRVTDRLIFQKLRRSPLAFVDRVTREDLAAGGARMDIALARMAYGSVLIWSYWNQAGEGEVEGNAPADYEKQQALEAGGYLPNSVKKDGKYVDASALNLSALPGDPQNNVATNVASIRQAYESGKADEGSTAEALGYATLSLLTELASTSFAENISTYLEPFQGQEEVQRDAAIANVAGSAASQFIPAMVRQYNQMYDDPVKRATTGDGSIPDRIYGRVAAAIPGLSDDLPAKYDLYGDQMQQGRTPSSMNNYQPIKDDAVSVELQRLERTTDDPVVRGAPSSFEHEGERIKLDAGEKQEWQRVQGYYLRTGMSQTIQTDEWRNATDAERIAIVKEIRTEAYDMTKEYMLPLLGVAEEDEE